MTFYIFFGITAFYNLKINLINLKITFLYRKIGYLFFVKLLKNYYNNFKNIVYIYNKIIYSLK